MRLTADLRATFTAEGAEPFTVDAAVEVARGENLVVLGPSGSGKSLLLETVAGFHPHEGRVTLADEPVHDRPPEEREFGFVFQDYALFPHLTVRENVEYGARYHEESRDADDLLSELGVAALAERYPPTLSGGEKQRVALARALAVRPAVLLLDEPLAALDVPTRQSLRNDLADALADVTSVYVTHNRTTARALADRIAVMRDGRVVQSGTPEAVFERPASPMVAEFTGANALPLSAVPSLAALLDDPTADGHVAIRPEAVTVHDAPGESPTDGDTPVEASSDGHPPAEALGDGDGRPAGLRATVERVVREDATHRVSLAVDDATLEAFADHPPADGETVWLAVDPDALHRC